MIQPNLNTKALLASLLLVSFLSVNAQNKQVTAPLNPELWEAWKPQHVELPTNAKLSGNPEVLGLDSQEGIEEFCMEAELLDSIYRWTWNAPSNTWILAGGTFHFYDENNYPARVLSRSYDGDVWEDLGGYVMSYDENGNQIGFHYETWDPTGANWSIFCKSVYTYDINNNQTRGVNQVLDDGNWIDYYQTLKTYDIENNLTVQLWQSWDGNEWVNTQQTLYTYDNRGDRISELYQTWNTTIWGNDWRRQYEYDADNNQTHYLFQDWNGYKWIDQVQFLNTFDANSNHTIKLHQSLMGGNWVNTDQDLYTYDGNDNQLSHEYQDWNLGLWEHSWRRNYTYDIDNNQTSNKRQNWEGNVWENDGQFLYTYDAKSNQTDNVCQSWNGSIWESDVQVLRTYNDDNNYETFVRTTWDATSMVQHDSSFYYYGEQVNTDVLKMGKELIPFPNPTLECSEILFDNPKNTEHTLYVFSSSGQLISQIDNITGEKVTIEEGSLQSGVYIFRLETAGKVVGQGRLVRQ